LDVLFKKAQGIVNYFLINFCKIFGSSKPWIRIRDLLEMPDPDQDSIYPDPQHETYVAEVRVLGRFRNIILSGIPWGWGDGKKILDV
jgi:hypothetical protein